jgi:hypothetical protein
MKVYLTPNSLYLNPNVSSKILKIKKREKSLINMINITEIDLNSLFNYFHNKGESFDPESCYQRDNKFWKFGNKGSSFFEIMPHK